MYITKKVVPAISAIIAIDEISGTLGLGSFVGLVVPCEDGIVVDPELVEVGVGDGIVFDPLGVGDIFGVGD